jgi:YbbR domain-containing protein
MRQKSQTIGTLGRAPARTSAAPEPTPPPFEPRIPPAAQREDGTLRRWLHGALFDNVALKFLSMVLAITVFLLVNTDHDSEAIASVGLSYTLPDNMELAPNQVAEINVKLRGSERQLRKLGPLEPIHLDLRDAPSGEVTITPDMIHVKPGLTIESVTPGTLHVAFDRRRDEDVLVSPHVVGHPKHGYVLAATTVSPAMVPIRGGDRVIRALPSIRTFEIDLDDHDESFDADVALVAPDGVTIARGGPVTVHVSITEELVTRALQNRPVELRGDGDPTKWTVTPATVDVTLTGTLLGVEKARDTVVAAVKLAKEDKQAKDDGKPKEVEVVLDGLPPGIGAKISPERVKLTPAKP